MRSVCMKCYKELNDDEYCDCSKEYAILYGDFKLSNDKVVCVCNSEDFKTTFHLNCNPKYVTNYQCVKCGNIIGKTVYYKSQYY